MSRLLVTGSAGFIAARTAELLLEAGHSVVGVDNLNDSYDVRLKRHRLDRLLQRPGFAFLEADVSRREALQAPLLLEQPFDAVINLAARPGVRYSVENPWVYVEANITGALNLLDFCRAQGIGKFVLASTSSLYGAHNPVPYSEEQDTSRPLSPYAATKKGAEALCHCYHALHGLDVSVLRYFTVYGPAGRPDMATLRFVQRIREGRPIVVYGDGSMSRDFTYVDDIARGTVAALRPLGYEIINLGSDQPHEVRELVALVEGAVGKKAVIEYQEAHAADVPTTWAKVEKAARLLAWRPQVALHEGIARTVAWYEAERAWAKELRVY